VLEEGRDRVKDLRTIETAPFDLSEIFRRVVEDAPRAPQVRITAEGAPRELHVISRREVEKIGTEAITNALRHAKASRIEVEIVFARHRLALRVIDDGIGIAPAVACCGRDGHFGLMDMRERALQIGAAFSVATRARGGTEIQLIVPAGMAYPPQEPKRRLRRVAAILQFRMPASLR
jgi:signal transduction histidine kinase